MSKKHRSKDSLVKLRESRNKHIRIINDIENKIVNDVLVQYESKNERDQLIQDARTFQYSEEKTKKIESVFQNDDMNKVMNYNNASDIIDARQFIQERKNESFFSKIANVIIINDED